MEVPALENVFHRSMIKNCDTCFVSYELNKIFEVLYSFLN